MEDSKSSEQIEKLSPTLFPNAQVETESSAVEPKPTVDVDNTKPEGKANN
jgi:hypothetical protein